MARPLDNPLPPIPSYTGLWPRHLDPTVLGQLELAFLSKKVPSILCLDKRVPQQSDLTPSVSGPSSPTHPQTFSPQERGRSAAGLPRGPRASGLADAPTRHCHLGAEATGKFRVIGSCWVGGGWERWSFRNLALEKGHPSVPRSGQWLPCRTMQQSHEKPVGERDQNCALQAGGLVTPPKCR